MTFHRVIMVLSMVAALLQAGGQVRVVDAGVDTTSVGQHVDSISMQSIGEVTVTSRRPGMSRVAGAENSMRINKAELFKAACCNLGESFTTNAAPAPALASRTVPHRSLVGRQGLSHGACPGREPARLARRCFAFRPGLCAGAMDEEHPGVEGGLVGAQRL